MSAVWLPIALLVGVAVLIPWGVSRASLGKLTADARWAAGALAVLCTVGAGTLARGTFLAGLVQSVADASQATRTVAAVAFVAAVGVALLAVVPDRFVAVPADQAAAVAGFLAPLLATYATAGAGRLGTSVLTFLTEVGDPVVRAVTG